MKIKLPKIHIKLTLALWLIFALIVLVEAYFLYHYLYLSIRNVDQVAPSTSMPVSSVNFPLYQEVSAWLEERQNYQITPYQLEGKDSGRENPLQEY